MYISENDLKSRLLTAQIEILNEAVSDIRLELHHSRAHASKETTDRFRKLYQTYSEWFTNLRREREKLKQEK